MDLKFIQLTNEQYSTELEVKSEGTFYLTDTDLYIGEKKLTNAADIENALKKYVKETDFKTALGELTSLTTSAQDNIVDAINELVTKYNELQTSEAVTLTTLEAPTTGYAKTYELKQGEKSVGRIDIPKDMVVTKGSVVENPTEELTGTYIKLVVNGVDDPIYIEVGKLVDIYTVAEEATDITLTIDSHTIKAEIKAGSITRDKLIGTFFDGLVTTSETEGAIKFNGSDVMVGGLKSAAFKESTAFDEAGAATKALSDAKTYTDSKLVWEPFPAE